MSKFAGLCILLVLTTVLHAEVGDLTPVACRPGQAVFVRHLMARRGQFSKRMKDDGTVSPQAEIATFKTGSDIIKVAVDSKSPDAKAPDLFRFDFTGKGKFHDKPVVPLKGRVRRGRFNGTTGMVTIQVQHDGGKIPVTLYGHYMKRGDVRYFRLVLSTAMEGSCRFGEKTLRVRLIDGNNNTRCNDKIRINMQDGKIRGMIPGDTILIYADGGAPAQKALIGQTVKVNGKWYRPNVSPDGLKISAEPVKVKTGKIRIPHKRWSGTLIGMNYLATLSGSDKAIEMPVGQYVVARYTEYRPGTGKGKRKEERLIRQGQDVVEGKGKVFEVTEGKVTEVSVGSPMTACMDVRQVERKVRFTLNLADASGGSVRYLAPRPAPPAIEVHDAAGKKVYSVKMRFG